MLLLPNEDLEKLDVVRRYQNFTSVVGNQAARNMFLEQYLALQDLSMPQELQERFVVAGHKLFLNLKLPAFASLPQRDYTCPERSMCRCLTTNES